MGDRIYYRILAVLMMLFPIFSFSAEGAGQRSINIWACTPSREDVRLTPYLAEGKGNIACIVCPGGSYFWLDRKNEGSDVAKWLRTNGISAFVLEYRVGEIAGFVSHYRLVARGNRYPDPLQDVQRSIQIIRENADRFGIDPDKVGVMGFSAGGHLAGMAGELFDINALLLMGIPVSVSLRPDFIVPVYPVVSFVDRSVHKRSRRGLMGEGKAISPQLKDSLSLERHVRADMPPVFLVNCVDDPTVDYRNSVLLDSALTAMKVPHRYLQFPTGGHGFGVNPKKTSPEAITWKDEFLVWLKDLFK